MYTYKLYYIHTHDPWRTLWMSQNPPPSAGLGRFSHPKTIHWNHHSNTWLKIQKCSKGMEPFPKPCSFLPGFFAAALIQVLAAVCVEIMVLSRRLPRKKETPQFNGSDQDRATWSINIYHILDIFEHSWPARCQPPWHPHWKIRSTRRKCENRQHLCLNSARNCSDACQKMPFLIQSWLHCALCIAYVFISYTHVYICIRINT